MAVEGGIMVPHPPLIIPEIGRGTEKNIQKTIIAYERAAEFVASLEPDTIVIVSPHSKGYSNYFHISPGKFARGDFSKFGAGQVEIECEYDDEFSGMLEQIADEYDFPAGTGGEQDAELDHGTMIPIYFIQKKYPKARYVRVCQSRMSLEEHYQFGMLVQIAAQRLDRIVVFVASGDLSHKLKEYGPYGYDPIGPEYDARIMDVMAEARFDELFDFSDEFCEAAAECGHKSFAMMAGALDGWKVSSRCLSYEDITGVGYGVGIYITNGRDDTRCFLSKKEEKLLALRAQEDAHVQLARRAIEYYVLSGGILDPEKLELPEEMLTQRAGVFVSLYKYGKLRGCIGTSSPVKANIANEIVNNAISAATSDQRFDPVRQYELLELEISVDVLGEDASWKN